MLALVDTEVEFVVAGGVAAVLHGVERATLDLDIAVNMGRENLTRFLTVMKELGLSPRPPVPPETLLDADQVKQMVDEKHALVFTFIEANQPLWQVDVLLRQDLSYRELRKDAVPVTVQGRQIWVTSVKKMIEMKKLVDPPRPKDLMDIAELERIEGENQ